MLHSFVLLSSFRKYQILKASLMPGSMPYLWCPMPVVEKLLLPDSGVPACRCGKKMRMVGRRSLREDDYTQIRIYDCRACHHEMHLTVWGSDTACADAFQSQSLGHLQNA